MTIQQLKYLIAVAEKGSIISITEAAKDLYLSQPSLSGGHAGRYLEDLFGKPDSRGIRLYGTPYRALEELAQ